MDDTYEINETMMDSGYSNEVIKNIEALKSQDEIGKYADSLMDIVYLEEIGQKDVYTQSVEEAEPFVKNCIEIAKYLFENKLSSREMIVQYLHEAIEYMSCIDSSGYYMFSRNEYGHEELKNKVADIISGILDEDKSYWKLLENDYKMVAKKKFTKVSKITIDDEVFEDFSQLQHYINGMILEALSLNDSIDSSLNVYLFLLDEENPHDEIKLDLSNMYDFDHLNYSFVNNMLEYLSDLSESELEDIMDGCTYDKCGIDLDAYKNKEWNTLKLEFLYGDIIDDLQILFSKGYRGHKKVFESIDRTSAIELALETLVISYKHDIEKLEYETQISKLEYRERNKDYNGEIYINTRGLENFLPEYLLHHEKPFILYLRLKAHALDSYRHSFTLAKRLNMDDILNFSSYINQSPRRSIGEVDSLIEIYNDLEDNSNA